MKYIEDYENDLISLEELQDHLCGLSESSLLLIEDKVEYYLNLRLFI